MPTRFLFMIMTFGTLLVTAAGAEQTDIAEAVLKTRLNNLESQAIQRRGREARGLDLLNRQDDRVAGQALNALKTIKPRSTAVPLLEGKLQRSRRLIGAFYRR